METEKMIMELRRIAKNHKNDRLCTGELNLTDMCTDVADRLEELNEFDKSQSAKLLKKLQEYEDLGITPEQIKEIDRLYAEKCREVAELKKKQTPMKPIKDRTQNIRYTSAYSCPNCGGGFAGTGIADYCYHCGQRLDWEG